MAVTGSLKTLAWRLVSISLALGGVILWAQVVPVHEIWIEGGLRGVLPVSDVRTLVRMGGVGATAIVVLVLWMARVKPWVSGLIGFLAGVAVLSYIATR